MNTCKKSKEGRSSYWRTNGLHQFHRRSPRCPTTIETSKTKQHDGTLPLSVELIAFMKTDPSLKEGLQATVYMNSATPTQPLMATGTNSQKDLMVTLIRTTRPKTQKNQPQVSQNTSLSRSTDVQSVRFNSPGLNRQITKSNQNQNYRDPENSNNNNNRYNNNQTNRYDSSGNHQKNI